MKSNLWNWFKKKEEISARDGYPGFSERQIWVAHIGENVGSEQNGKGKQFLRPVVILRKFNKEIFWAVPLTSTIKNLPFYFNVSFNASTSPAILTQVRLMDVRRLSHHIGTIPQDEFNLLIKKFKALLP